MPIERVRLHLACGFISAEANGEGIIALFTVVLAISTVWLWRSTNTLALATEHVAAISEKALTDLERGYLYVMEFRGDIDALLETTVIRFQTIIPHIEIVAMNFGRTPCTIVQGSMALRFLHEEPEVVIGVHIEAEEGVVTKGTFADFVVGPSKPHRFPRLFATGNMRISVQQLRDGEISAFCYGWIRYIDIFNKPHPIVFCRRYDIEAMDWEPVGGSAKNYTG